MNNDPTESEMVAFLQAKGAKFDEEFGQWLYPGVRGYLTTIQMYHFLKMVDKK